MPPEGFPPEGKPRKKPVKKKPPKEIAEGEPSHGERWSKPSPLGYSAAMDSVGTVASPLLAGFSLASVVVISEDSGNFRWPGIGILALSVAAILFLAALEASFNARRFIWSAADVAAWWPEIKRGSTDEDNLRAQQTWAFGLWENWVRWARRMYNGGVLALFIGLSSAIPPPPGAHTEAALRWVAAGVVFMAFIAELVWMIIGIRSRPIRRLWRW
jgi:hypothetical protein